MAAKKQASAKIERETMVETPFVQNASRNFLNSKVITIILLVVALAALAYWKKSWIVAATVNGSPITSLELQTRLNENFRTQGLQDLIDEKIILTEARKNNSLPSASEIDAKFAELATSYGGLEEFEKLLVAQGESKENLLKRIKLNLALDKMYSALATVEAKEIDDYVKVNKSLLKATDSAGQKLEAEMAIKEQKLFKVIQEKFQELKSRAVVVTF